MKNNNIKDWELIIHNKIYLFLNKTNTQLSNSVKFEMHNLYLFYRLNLATLKTRGKQKPEKPIKLRKLEKNNRKNRTVKKNRLNRLEF
jgi:hypothetical protein